MAVRAAWPALVALALLTVGACKDRIDRQAPTAQAGCLPDEVTSLELAASPQLVRIPNDAPAEVSVTVTPRTVNAAALAGGEGEAYWYDLGGDGTFEGQFVGRSTALEVTAPVRYPLQVTATLCGGGIVAARTQIQGFRSQPPIVTLQWGPREPYWLQVGDSLAFDVYAIDPDGAGPLDVWWHWGDGAGGLETAWDFSGGNLFAQHIFSARGIREFELRVTDVAGDTTIIRKPLLISALAEAVLDLRAGALLTSAQTLAWSATQPAEGTLLVAALDGAGVAAYRPVSDAVRLEAKGRTRLYGQANAEPLDLAVDPTRRIVAAAAGDYGIFVIDVTDPTTPRSVRPVGTAPGPLIPAISLGPDLEPAARVRIQRVWLCNEGAWMLALNAGEGIYLWTLAGEAELAAARAKEVEEPGAIANPWIGHPRVVGGQPAGPSIPGDTVRGVACAAGRYVGVLREASLDLYDVTPLLADGSAAAVMSIALPTTAPGIAPRGTDLTATELAGEPGVIRWTATLGPHGLAEWASAHGPAGITETTLTRRYWQVLDRNFSPDEWDTFTAVWRSDDVLMVGDDSYGLGNAALRLDFSLWTTDEAQDRWYHWKNDKCNPSMITNPTSGDALEFVTGCSYLDPPQRFIGTDHEHVWARAADGDQVRFHRFALTDGTAYSGWKLPERWQAAAMATDAVWVFPADRVAIYDATEPTGAVSPAPREEIPLPLAPKYVIPGPPGSTAMLIANDLRMGWLSPGPDGRPVVAATAETGGVAAAALLPTGWVGLLPADSTRVEIWRLQGGALFDIGSPSIRPGYVDVVACPTEFYAMRAEDDGWAIDRFKPILGTLNHTVQTFPWGRLDGERPAAWNCDADGLWLAADEPDSDTVRIDLWPLGVSSGTRLASLRVPYQPNDPPLAIRLVRSGDLLLLHLAGRLSGVHVFDMTNPASPDYVAADLGPSIGGLTQLHALADPGGGLRYGGIWDGPDGTALIVRRVR